MKKILLFLLFFISVRTFAQYPNGIQTLGSDSNLVQPKGGFKARVINWTFTDTTQANTQHIKQYPGAQIFTTSDNKFWLRNANADGWIGVGSGGGSPTDTTGKFLNAITYVNDSTIRVWIGGTSYPIRTGPGAAGSGGANGFDSVHVSSDSLFLCNKLSGACTFAFKTDTTIIYTVDDDTRISEYDTTTHPGYYTWFISRKNWRDSLNGKKIDSGAYIPNGGVLSYDSAAQRHIYVNLPTYPPQPTPPLDDVLTAGNVSTQNATVGTLNITATGAGSSTDSVMVIDLATGEVKYRNPASLGGGGSGDSTLQQIIDGSISVDGGTYGDARGKDFYVTKAFSIDMSASNNAADSLADFYVDKGNIIDDPFGQMFAKRDTFSTLLKVTPTHARIRRNAGTLRDIITSINGTNFADSTGNATISIGGSGTVTNIATGYGLSGGAITTTGTLIADSATLSNYYVRRKDSVATGYYPYSTNPKNYLTTIDTTNIANFSTKVRSLISATAPITYVNGLIALGTVPIANGGTNITTYTTGDILYASATNVLSKLPIGTTSQTLHVVAGLPAWRDTTASGGGSSITRQVITSGSSGTVTGGNYLVTIDPASTLASYTLTMPASPTDLQTVEVQFGGTLTSGTIVTALTISPNSGQTILDNTPPGSSTADDTIFYTYRSANTKWYRRKL